MTGHQRNPPQRILDGYACTRDEWIALRDIGLKMIQEGLCNKDTAPLRAYQHQKGAAERRRGIEWKLTLLEWWKIWEESGHWHDRGLGRGWQMCRNGDLGAYEVGNVFIGYGAENLSAAAKRTDLPIGVAYTSKGKDKPFRAYCNVYGRQRHIGMFATADEASRAYLKAIDLDDEMKVLANERFELLKAEVQRKPLSLVIENAINGQKSLASRYPSKGAAA